MPHTKDDETRSHDSRHSTAAESLEGQEHERSQQHTTDGRIHAHGNVRNTRLDVVLANFLEVELSIEAGEPSSQGNEHLGEGRVHIHKELALDVLGSETTEARRELSL